MTKRVTSTSLALTELAYKTLQSQYQAAADQLTPLERRQVERGDLEAILASVPMQEAQALHQAVAVMKFECVEARWIHNLNKHRQNSNIDAMLKSSS